MEHYMLLPIHNRAKEIVSFTVVDEADYHWALQWRWHLDRYGYPKHMTGGHHHLHREIMKPPTNMEVDHIDRNPRNNRRSNLRICTHAENHQNKAGWQRNSSSSYRGVSWEPSRNRWRAKHKLNGKTYNIGRFLTEIEAAEAAAQFRAEHMPFSIEGR
jgi:hypothetical protein